MRMALRVIPVKRRIDEEEPRQDEQPLLPDAGYPEERDDAEPDADIQGFFEREHTYAGEVAGIIQPLSTVVNFRQEVMNSA